MAKTVFAIEQGSYSDYRVVGVFTTREAADKIATLINDGGPADDAAVAEWPLDPGIEQMNQGLRPYEIRMLYDGQVDYIEEESISARAIYGRLSIWERTKAIAWVGRPIADMVTGVVWAEDEKHAIKIANEFRTQSIASGQMRVRE